MSKTRLFTLSKILPILLVWISLQSHVNAQETSRDNKQVSPEYPRVEWVKNWPSADNKKTKKKFKDQFNAVLFGIKAPVLNNPVAVLANSPDDFWILDQGNKTVFRVQKGVGDIPHSIAKSDLDLSSLVGICAGANSDILFTDSKAQKIYRISTEKKKPEIVNDTLVLEQPTGIAYLSAKKEIWVVESKAHRIAVLNENGERIKTIGHRGNAEGEFNYPTHIWIDKKGYIYINDAMNFRVQVLNAEGDVISVFGQAGDASGYLSRPKGIATDSFGNIYVVDALFHAVQVFDLKGNFLYTFGNQGHGIGEFWMPSGIYIDSLNTIYVADTYNSRIQVFKLIYTEIK
jgi:DNA-binding beta-propeller fold protein YncE